MKAIVARHAGDPSVLAMEEVPPPEIEPGQALVRVVHAGVNFADIVMRRGGLATAFPLIPGVEAAGTVAAVAADVVDVAVGDRVAYAPVAAATAIGSYAEYHTVPTA
ncbi:MAG TPA: alcohol dehydrogenase catalytic domain-containing protein [Acidimicrobiales bacterium]|nr:alcohol dehydrogenase catalytic domain-containing protein [Acidimicrobiales bacterium]